MDEEGFILPDDHIMQIGSTRFKFDIITNTRAFKDRLSYSTDNDLVRDHCDESLSEVPFPEKIPRKDYIRVVQKSPTWFYLRAQAQGTASSVGKYIKGPTRFPVVEDVKAAWVDKINKEPFKKTHTMAGHMNWGVGYEDPALVHLAMEEDVCVSQVGTIRVDLSYILKMGKLVFKDDYVDLGLETKGQHLLISPDGIVGKPEKKPSSERGTVRTELSPELLGMLEIKCMSPFYHIESHDEYLYWVDDIETRQWFEPHSIPFVYVIQMCLQAISGVSFLKMKSTNTMWFIRWSPNGVSIFKLPFKELIRLGIVASQLYFHFIQNVKTLEDIETELYPLSGAPEKVNIQINKAYIRLMEKVTHKYVKITDYPEFALYQDCTRYFKFKIPDIDPKDLQVELKKKEDADKPDPAPDVESGECLI